MEIFKCYITLLLCLISYNEIVTGFSCDYAECTCMEDMITCVGVTAPRFKYRATVTMLYMDSIMVVNLLDVIKNLPNLKYLSLMNMKYFNCKWLEEIDENVNVRSNMCFTSSTIFQYSSIKQISTEKTVSQDKMLSTSYWSKFSPVTDISEGQDFKEISEQIDKRQSDPNQSIITLSYNEEFATQSTTSPEYSPKKKISKDNYSYFWWISLAVLSCVVVVIIIISILYICRKKFIRGIEPRDIEEMDDSVIPLSQCLNQDNTLSDEE